MKAVHQMLESWRMEEADRWTNTEKEGDIKLMYKMTKRNIPIERE